MIKLEGGGIEVTTMTFREGINNKKYLLVESFHQEGDPSADWTPPSADCYQ